MKEEKTKNIKKAVNGKVRALFEERKKKLQQRKAAKRLKISDIKRGEGSQVGHLIKKIKAKEVQLTFIFVVVILLLILISLYFVFSSVRQPVRYDTFETGSLEVTFYNRGKRLGNIVDLTPIRPMAVEVGEKTKAYKIKIVNTSAKEQSFQIKLMKDVAMVQEDDCEDIQLSSGYVYYQINGYEPQALDGAERTPIIYMGTLGGKETRIVNVRLWVGQELPSEYIDFHYHGKLAVKAIKTAND